MIYKEFVLRSPEDFKRLLAFVKLNGDACTKKDTPLKATITTGESKRTSEMNAYYWKCVIGVIAEQAWVNNRQFDKDVWHEHMARQYGVCEDMELPSGEVVVRRKSTTQMTVTEFSEYMENVKSDAANNLGVIFE